MLDQGMEAAVAFARTFFLILQFLQQPKSQQIATKLLFINNYQGAVDFSAIKIDGCLIMGF